MKAIILCAGYARRMYPLTSFIAKPLLPIAGKPVVNYILDKISNIRDIDEVYVVTNSKFHSQFEEWLKYNQNDYRMKIKLHNNTRRIFGDRNVGGIDAVSKIMKKTKDSEGYLIIAGDNLVDYSLREGLKFFKKVKSPVLYLAKISKNEAHKFGVVQIDKDNKVINFEEKPKNPKSNLIGTLIYYFTIDEIKLIDDYNGSSNKGDSFGYFLQYLIKKKDLYGFIPNGKFIDIGSLNDYKKANKIWASS